jgi:lipopolysaccharide transport system permease protein
MHSDVKDWAWEIKPVGGFPKLDLKELWQYRDLLVRFVKRDFIVSYRQTILGPIWVFLEPLIATFVYYIIFGAVLKASTDEIPPLAFYLSGIVIWAYFSDGVGTISYTFVQNASIFGKVYFPRLIVPISMLLSKLARLGIQLLMLITVYLIYKINGSHVRPNLHLLLVPFLILLTSAFSLGFGLILASLAARYRDVQNLMMFLIRILMFATPVVYPYSLVPQQYKLWIGLNPLTPIIETFRFALFNTGSFSAIHLLYSAVFISILLFIGIVFFNKVEQNVIDTI